MNQELFRFLNHSSSAPFLVDSTDSPTLLPTNQLRENSDDSINLSPYVPEFLILSILISVLCLLCAFIHKAVENEEENDFHRFARR